MPLSQLEAWAKSATLVLAADGASDRLAEVGIRPSAVVGDMDSVRANTSENSVYDPDQDSSDCDKLLTFAARSGHRRITLASIEGNRIDHLLGTLASCARASLEVRLALRTGLAYLLKGPCDFRFEAEVGELVSLMPLELCEDVVFSGVEWPLSKVTLAPSVFVSLSNRVVEASVNVKLASGYAVLFHLADRLSQPSWPGEGETHR